MLPLKEATSIKHRQAEKMPFNMRMIEGLLSKEEYVLYLNQQLQIFKAMENRGVPHDSLKRAERIEQDIAELNAQKIYSDTILNSTQEYVNYLNALSDEELLAHIYLNYLALMFGGQITKKSVPSTGKMYDFENMQEGMMSVRKVQKDEWADEVNKGFDFNIQLFDELESACKKLESTSNK
ncbi:MAG: biliverdin-producing heme oxygenase [Chitinophagales bacterium]